jgi:ABC-type antimicrobial peptide transport system permease subunit
LLLYDYSSPPISTLRGMGRASDKLFETLTARERRVASNRPGLAALEKGARPCANVQRMVKMGDAKNSLGTTLKAQGDFMQSVTVDPTISWIVWGLLLVGTFVMTVLGTWLIARRWKK